jgi:hypothetical protein
MCFEMLLTRNDDWGIRISHTCNSAPILQAKYKLRLVRVARFLNDTLLSLFKVNTSCKPNAFTQQKRKKQGTCACNQIRKTLDNMMAGASTDPFLQRSAKAAFSLLSSVMTAYKW